MYVLELLLLIFPFWHKKNKSALYAEINISLGLN